MPPPPPPSKSYLLKFTDSDLEDDSDDADEETVPSRSATQTSVPGRNEEQSFPIVTPPPPPPPGEEEDDDDDVESKTRPGENKVVTLEEKKEENSVKLSSSATLRSPAAPHVPETETILLLKENDTNLNNVNDDYDHDDIEDDDYPEEKDNPAAKSKRKRRKRKKKKPRKNSASQPKERRNVHFGTVREYEFERCLSRDGIPGDGGWPLGLSSTLLSKSPPRSVDDYETAKQERLKERWNDIRDPSSPDEATPPESLETRQWDYLRGSKNPLFGLLSEKERMTVLLESSSATTTTTTDTSSASFSSSSCLVQPSSSPERTRHSSRSSKNWSERFNDRYPQTEVHRVRHELEQIRASRATEGSVGCTCRKLNVYIPPPDAGRKAQHRRLSLLKVKEELRKRSMLPKESKTREELELLLHDIVETEPCCTSDCVCAQNGLQCQDDACTCWYWSHQAQKGKHDQSRMPSVETIRARCGNKYGIYAVDVNRIRAFRNQFVYCQAIGAPGNDDTVGVEGA